MTASFMAGVNAAERFDREFDSLLKSTDTCLQHLIAAARNAIQDAINRGVDPRVLLFDLEDHALLTAAMRVGDVSKQNLFSLVPPPILEPSLCVPATQVWVGGPPA